MLQLDPSEVFLWFNSASLQKTCTALSFCTSLTPAGKSQQHVDGKRAQHSHAIQMQSSVSALISVTPRSKTSEEAFLRTTNSTGTPWEWGSQRQGHKQSSCAGTTLLLSWVRMRAVRKGLSLQEKDTPGRSSDCCSTFKRSDSWPHTPTFLAVSE